MADSTLMPNAYGDVRSFTPATHLTPSASGSLGAPSSLGFSRPDGENKIILQILGVSLGMTCLLTAISFGIVALIVNFLAV